MARMESVTLHDRCACGRRKPASDYVCWYCDVYGHDYSPPLRLVAKPRVRVVTEGLGNKNGGLTLCDYCPPAQFRECRECVKAGAPVGCEWVAVSDVAKS